MFVVGRETNSSSSLMIKTFLSVNKKNEMGVWDALKRRLYRF